MPLSPGLRIDRYEIVRAVASGGMGTVWLARAHGEHGFERAVAIKSIRADLATSEQARTLFLDEARIAARIEHPHVAQVLDVADRDGEIYIVLEWVDGSSLERLCAERTEPPPLAAVLRIAADICEGLDAAHGSRDARGELLGLVHRDISPHNILVSRAGIAKLIDFGIAKARDRLAGETESGIVRGKRAYMSPEQASAASVDRRTDVWAIGAVIVRALTGSPPPIGGDVNTRLAQLPASLPVPVRDVLARALADAPAERWQTAAELQRALEEAMVATGARATSADVASTFAGALDPVFEVAPAPLPATVPLQPVPIIAPTPGSDSAPETVSLRPNVAVPALPRSRRAWWLAAALLVLAGIAISIVIVASSDGIVPALRTADATVAALADAPGETTPVDANPVVIVPTPVDAGIPAPTAQPPPRPKVAVGDAVRFRFRGEWRNGAVRSIGRDGTARIWLIGDRTVTAKLAELQARKRLPPLAIGQQVRLRNGLVGTISARISTEEYWVQPRQGPRVAAVRSDLSIHE